MQEVGCYRNEHLEAFYVRNDSRTKIAKKKRDEEHNITKTHILRLCIIFIKFSVS